MNAIDSIKAQVEANLCKRAASDREECGDQIDSTRQIKGRDTCARCAPADTHD